MVVVSMAMCWPAWTDPFWSNWAIVLITIGAVCVACYTLRELIEQTEATKIAAEAAKKSADAIVALERPHIFLLSAIRDTIANRLEAPDDPPTRWTVKFRIKNFGRTPAVIQAIDGGLQFADRIDDGIALWEYPPELGEPMHQIYDPVLLPDAESSLLQFICSDQAATEAVERLERKKHPMLWLVFHLTVVYSGPFEGDRYIYKVCRAFHWDKQSFTIPCGPEMANRHTNSVLTT